MHPITPPALALSAIDAAAEDALALSERAFDEATMSYRNAVDLIHALRKTLGEIRACVAETRTPMPPDAGPCCSAAVEVIRDELRRIDTLDGWSETVTEQPLPAHIAEARKRWAS